MGYANDRLHIRSESRAVALEAFEQAFLEEVEASLSRYVLLEGQLRQGKDGVELYLSTENGKACILSLIHI